MRIINDKRFQYLIVIFTTFAFYSRTLSYGFIWDDLNYIVNSQVLGVGTDFFDLWTKKITADFWPLTYSFLWILKYYFGNNPFAYHFSNVILFTLSCVLLFHLLNRLKVHYAFLLVIIFCIHPMNVSAVSWAFQIKTNLTNVFGLLSAIFFIKFFEAKSFKSYSLSICFLILSFLSKISLVMLPLIFLLYAVVKTKTLFNKKIFFVIPFFVTSIIFGFANMFWERGLGYTPSPPSEMILTNNLLVRLLVMGQNILFYLYQSFFPINLMFVHPKIEPIPDSFFSYVPLLILLTFFLGTLFYIIFKKGKSLPSMAIGMLISFSLLMPVSSLFEIYYMRFSYVAEHYLTLALIGFVAPAVIFLAPKRWGMAVVSVYILFLGFQTYNYTSDYESEKTVFESNLTKNPNDLLSHNVLGLLYKNENNFTKALYHFKLAIEIHPNAAAYYNRAVVFEKLDRLDEALANFEKAIELNPYISNSYSNLGLVYLKKKNIKVALEYLNLALERAPNNPSIAYNIGYAYETSNNLLKAKEWYQKAFLLSPSTKLFADALDSVSK